MGVRLQVPSDHIKSMHIMVLIVGQELHMLMTGTPRKAEASAFEMTVSTAMSLPAVKMDDSTSDLPALLAWTISDKCHRNGGVNGGAGEFCKKRFGEACHFSMRAHWGGAAAAAGEQANGLG